MWACRGWFVGVPSAGERACRRWKEGVPAACLESVKKRISNFFRFLGSKKIVLFSVSLSLSLLSLSLSLFVSTQLLHVVSHHQPSTSKSTHRQRHMHLHFFTSLVLFLSQMLRTHNCKYKNYQCSLTFSPSISLSLSLSFPLALPNDNISEVE